MFGVAFQKDIFCVVVQEMFPALHILISAWFYSFLIGIRKAKPHIWLLLRCPDVYISPMKFELAKQNSYLKLPLGLTPMPCPDVYISPDWN